MRTLTSREAPEEDDVADVFAYPHVDLVPGRIAHGGGGDALGFIGEPVERPSALGHGRQCGELLVRGGRLEILLQPAKDDVGGGEMVVDVVETFMEGFQSGEASGGESTPAGSISKGDDGSGERSVSAASGSANCVSRAATPTPVNRAEHWGIPKRRDLASAAALGERVTCRHARPTMP